MLFTLILQEGAEWPSIYCSFSFGSNKNHWTKQIFLEFFFFFTSPSTDKKKVGWLVGFFKGTIDFKNERTPQNLRIQMKGTWISEELEWTASSFYSIVVLAVLICNSGHMQESSMLKKIKSKWLANPIQQCCHYFKGALMGWQKPIKSSLLAWIAAEQSGSPSSAVSINGHLKSFHVFLKWLCLQNKTK